jgi:hypothetical protein
VSFLLFFLGCRREAGLKQRVDKAVEELKTMPARVELERSSPQPNSKDPEDVLRNIGLQGIPYLIQHLADTSPSKISWLTSYSGAIPSTTRPAQVNEVVGRVITDIANYYFYLEAGGNGILLGYNLGALEPLKDPKSIKLFRNTGFTPRRLRHTPAP